MTYTLLVHILNDDPIVGEVEELPAPIDNSILIENPRRKDGKDVHYLDADVVSIILPVARITFIEILAGEMEEEIISFVKD